MCSFPLFSLVLLSNPNELMTISVWKRNKFSHFSTLSYKVVCRIHKEHMEIGWARKALGDGEKAAFVQRENGKNWPNANEIESKVRLHRAHCLFVCVCAMEIFALFAKIWHISLTNFATAAPVLRISYAMWFHGLEVAEFPLPCHAYVAVLWEYDPEYFQDVLFFWLEHRLWHANENIHTCTRHHHRCHTAFTRWFVCKLVYYQIHISVTLQWIYSNIWPGNVYKLFSSNWMYIFNSEKYSVTLV